MKKFDLRKIFYNDQRLKLFSLVLAIFFWFIIVSYISPDYSVTVNSAKITASGSDSTLSYFKLSVIQLSQQEVSIEVSGPRYLIGKLSASDFIVRPKFSQITSSGNYSVELTAEFKNPDSRMKIKQINPSSVSIYFDKKVTKSVPVEVVVQNTKIADGYIMQTAVVNPKTIDVTGPEEEMANVAKAVATVKVQDNANSILNTTSNVVLYGSNKKTIDISHMSLNLNKVNVVVPILLTKNVPLTLDFSNLPAGFDSSNISTAFTPKNVRIAGTTDVINAISEINLGTVDFSTLDITNNIKFNLQLPAGTSDIENVNTAVANITLNNTSQKIFSTKKIYAINVPNGMHVIIKTKLINNIQLYGPTSGINSIANVEAVVDMSKVKNGVGQYEVPVTIIVPSQTGYWTRTQYKALVYVY